LQQVTTMNTTVLGNADMLETKTGGGPGKVPITVVVPVKNEEENLPHCLDRLSRFANVIVIDSGSDDDTPMIALRYGAELVQFVWDGKYPKKRNWILLNHKFNTDWVLFLDADEFVDDTFCDAVALAVDQGGYDGFWLNYTNYFLDRELKYGLPQRKLAMFKVGSGLYERIDEMSWSKLDMEIHEHPQIDGKVGEIAAVIVHHDFRGIGKFVDKHTDYAIWEAHRYLLLEKSGGLRGKGLTGRQRFKYRNISRWWYPWFYFLYTYCFRLGFLDGTAGFLYAFYKTWYFITIRLLICEVRADGNR
jgi:glycosyltransferase involved in cell wall biosynthesis